MKIIFYGVGGVGGYYAALIANRCKDQHEIYFIARGEHLKVINEKGLTLEKNGGNEIINVSPKLCTNTINEVPVCDIIFFIIVFLESEV